MIFCLVSVLGLVFCKIGKLSEVSCVFDFFKCFDLS